MSARTNVRGEVVVGPESSASSSSPPSRPSSRANRLACLSMASEKSSAITAPYSPLFREASAEKTAAARRVEQDAVRGVREELRARELELLVRAGEPLPARRSPSTRVRTRTPPAGSRNVAVPRYPLVGIRPRSSKGKERSREVGEGGGVTGAAGGVDRRAQGEVPHAVRLRVPQAVGAGVPGARVERGEGDGIREVGGATEGSAGVGGSGGSRGRPSGAESRIPSGVTSGRRRRRR